MDSRPRLHLALSIWLVICAVCHLYFVVAVFSNAIFWLTYYVANYEFGFVRRGLAGELLRLFPDDQYFTAAYSILWVSIIGWLFAVAVLLRMVVLKGPVSERRIMLALTIPVLPFSFSYAVYNPHPELFGMAALLAFSISMTKFRTDRSQLIVSALYGITMGVLALVHEAIPLALALGAVLALVVLPKGTRCATRRICAVLAVGPGIASVLSVALLGRHDVAARLCAQVPHGMVDNPWAAATTARNALDYLLGRIESRSDYHDWACKNATPIHDADVSAAVQFVGHFGVFRLVGSFALGLLFFVGTIWMIRYFSGVPAGVVVNDLPHHRALLALASMLLIPLFMTGVDWTRWWVLITFDVASVYILRAIDSREIEQPPSRRSALVFACLVIALAVIPTGAANNIGG
ncbi:MAG: hypothetical protein WCB92_15510 [Mycobacterium sp.]